MRRRSADRQQVIGEGPADRREKRVNLCLTPFPRLDYRPDYFLSGHIHQFPISPGSGWRQIVNGVNVQVLGQLLSGPFPNHIVLNTVSKETGWETSSREWIPEDGLYEHLVVKFPRE